MVWGDYGGVLYEAWSGVTIENVSHNIFMPDWYDLQLHFWEIVFPSMIILLYS